MPPAPAPAPDPRRAPPRADGASDATLGSGALDALWRGCEAPEVLGYELLGELGSGGQARVYQARAARTGARVAIKRWVDPLLDADVARRLEREVEALRRADHPGVVRYLELVRDALGCPCLVMELVEGTTLAEHLRQHGALRPRALGLLAFGLVDALAHVHARGVVHRDLKPQNVMLRQADGRPVLVDFGIAHLAERSRVTAAGAPLGTRDYMAPEQYEGRGFVGPPTDIYALGATLLHAGAGRWPIHHDAPAVLGKAGVPAELAAVIERCLRYRPEDRYSRADGALRAHVAALLVALPAAELAPAHGLPGSSPECPARAAAPLAPKSPSPPRALRSPARHPPELAAYLRDEQRRCGSYVLLSEVGRGGFGTVLRAWDLRHEREVALKLLEHLDPARRARFEREIKATARLAHPHIVPLLDSGEHRGRPFLVTELVRGRTLGAIRAERAGLDVSEAVRLAREVALALAHAHANGVLHRDVKPDNVLIDAAGRARLVDFGLARLEDRSRLTGTGLVLGTAGYMPPEQLDGPDERLDPRADVYSLGATLYYALSGEPPFRGETQREVYAQLACRDPDPPSRIDPSVSEELDTICLKCLEKDPRDRYGSAAEVADELLRVLEQRPIRARPPTAPARLRKWVRRNRALAGALGLAGLLALTGSAALVHQAKRGAAALAAKEAEERSGAEARRRSAAEALEARVRAVEALLDRVAADPGAVDLEQALDELGRGPHPAVVALLARRLDLLTETLWDAQVALLLGAQPNEQERALGLTPIEGLTAALAAWRGLPLDGRPLDEIRAPIREAGRRLVLRYRRRLRPEARGDAPTAVQQVVTAQEAALGAGGRALGPLLCRALGRLGVREGAVEAVGRFLIAHPDAERSTLPAQALATLGGPLAAAAIERQLERFEGRGSFAAVARPLLAQLGAPLDDTEELASADAYVERGRRRHLRGDLAGAVADFDAALATAPDHPEALNGRALAAWASGEHADAERALARLVELRPDSVAAWVNLGALRLERGGHRGAIAATSRALELQPEHAGALTNRGLASLHLGDLAAARVDLERAASLGSDEAATWTAYGQVLWHQGERDHALAAFDRALALDPRDAHALSHRGRLRAELGAATEGEADVTQAVGLRPDLALAWFYRALIRRALGRRAEARSDLDQALACASPPPAGFTLRGYLRLDEGDAAGAVDDFDAALRAKRDAGAYTGRALALRRLGRTEQAQRDLERAIELAPDLPAPRVNLANLLVAQGEPAAAVAAYEGAIRAAPNAAQAWSGLASAQLALGRFEEASRSARRALTLAPNEPMAHVNEGAARLHLGDAADARASAERALALDPNLVQAWTLRAAAEAALGDHGHALQSAERALLLDPLHPEAWRVKGDALRHAHQLTPALAAYERFLELAPEHPNAADVQDLTVRLADLAARTAAQGDARPTRDAER